MKPKEEESISVVRSMMEGALMLLAVVLFFSYVFKHVAPALDPKSEVSGGIPVDARADASESVPAAAADAAAAAPGVEAPAEPTVDGAMKRRTPKGPMSPMAEKLLTAVAFAKKAGNAKEEAIKVKEQADAANKAREDMLERIDQGK